MMVGCRTQNGSKTRPHAALQVSSAPGVQSAGQLAPEQPPRQSGSSLMADRLENTVWIEQPSSDDCADASEIELQKSAKLRMMRIMPSDPNVAAEALLLPESRIGSERKVSRAGVLFLKYELQAACCLELVEAASSTNHQQAVESCCELIIHVDLIANTTSSYSRVPVR